MEHRHGAAALAACVALLATHAPAQPSRVSRSDQAAADTERLRILRAELAHEEAQAATQDGAQRHRALQNIEALQREVAAAERSATPTATSPATPARPSKTPRRSPAWWDVYARNPQPPALPAPPYPAN